LKFTFLGIFNPEKGVNTFLRNTGTFTRRYLITSQEINSRPRHDPGGFVAGLSTRKYAFNPRSVSSGLVVDKLVLGQIFLSVI
jgi:hypothetical protein